jgi:GT2 family glycosyltransferase
MTGTLIIPTYNGGHRIDRCLKAIQNLVSKPDEIIVVIDGSTDDTFEKVSKWMSVLPDLRVIQQENMGRAAVRNTGAAAASAELLLFLDDDMEVTQNWLTGHLSHHAAHPQSLLVGAHENKIVGDDDFQGWRNSLSRRWIEPLRHFYPEALPSERAFLTGANCSLPADLFRKLGGFDSRLKDAEDQELANRAAAAGFNIYYNENVLAWHRDGLGLKQYVKRRQEYARNSKIPSLALPESRERRSYLASLKRQFFQIFCSPIWLRLVESRHWMKLPRKARFKLYDLIVTANGDYFPERSCL